MQIYDVNAKNRLRIAPRYAVYAPLRSALTEHPLDAQRPTILPQIRAPWGPCSTRCFGRPHYALILGRANTLNLHCKQACVAAKAFGTVINILQKLQKESLILRAF